MLMHFYGMSIEKVTELIKHRPLTTVFLLEGIKIHNKLVSGE